MKGIILKESLADVTALELVKVVMTETWQVNNAAPFQPSTWTALFFETGGNRDDAIAESLSRALKPAWYIDATTDIYVYVIFPDTVFKYRKGDKTQREAAHQHGRSLGIPEHQLDWGE